MDDEEIVVWLQMAVMNLARIPTVDLESYIRGIKEGNQRHESFAPVLDPEHYFRAQRTGEFEDAKHQEAIVTALLDARKAIDARESFAAKKRGQP